MKYIILDTEETIDGLKYIANLRLDYNNLYRWNWSYQSKCKGENYSLDLSRYFIKNNKTKRKFKIEHDDRD